MMKPPTPADEQERLEALEAWRILDSGSDDAFDDLVEIATAMFDTPVGLVSLIGKDRQWFKARKGVAQEESPREYSVCAHAILDPENPFVAPDFREDERFRDNPLLEAAGLRSYVGVPLVDTDGMPLGSICVMDTEPLDDVADLDDKLDVLRRLSRQAMRLIEHRAVSGRLAEALEAVERLETLVPICAWCDRIRDDEDYWRSVDEFLKSQGIDLTHGICPSCLEDLDGESAGSASPPSPR